MNEVGWLSIASRFSYTVALYCAAKCKCRTVQLKNDGHVTRFRGACHTQPPVGNQVLHEHFGQAWANGDTDISVTLSSKMTVINGNNVIQNVQNPTKCTNVPVKCEMPCPKCHKITTFWFTFKWDHFQEAARRSRDISLWYYLTIQVL